jgi:hypothetical protein
MLEIKCETPGSNPAQASSCLSLHPIIPAAGPAVSAHVLAVSDVGLRALEGRGAPPPPPLFVHYDLPVRKVGVPGFGVLRLPKQDLHLLGLPRRLQIPVSEPDLECLLLTCMYAPSSTTQLCCQIAFILADCCSMCSAFRLLGCSWWLTLLTWHNLWSGYVAAGHLHAAGGGGQQGPPLGGAPRHRRVLCRRRQGG